MFTIVCCLVVGLGLELGLGLDLVSACWYIKLLCTRICAIGCVCHGPQYLMSQITKCVEYSMPTGKIRQL